MRRPLRRPTLFPYTTLFRSVTEDTDYRAITRVRALDGPYLLRPGETIHGITRERIRLPGDVAGWSPRGGGGDRKSTRLNSSHVEISYAVLCSKKNKTTAQSP